MQKITTLLYIVFLCQILSATEIKSNIEKVTVYLDQGAKIDRTAKINLKKGANLIIIDDVEEGIDHQTIQIAFNNSDIQLSNINLLNTFSKDSLSIAKIEILQDSLQVKEQETFWINKQIEILRKEDSLLLSIDKVYNNIATHEAEKLRILLAFYRQHSLGINKEILRLKEARKELDVTKNEIKKMMRELASKNRKRFQIHFNVVLKFKYSGKMELSYFIKNCNWYPHYDLRVAKINEPLIMDYKAVIRNNSGVDWKDVKLLLSSARPRTKNYPAKLKTRFARFKRAASVDTVLTFDPEVYEEQVHVVKNEDISRIKKLGTSFLLEFEEPLTLPSSSKTIDLLIKKESVPARYEYYVNPSMSTNVYLMAYIQDYSNYNLLSGSMNVYYDNTFIGKSKIDPTEVTDTLSISLGVDHEILVDIKERDFTSPKFLGANKIVMNSYTIGMKNSKKKPIEIRIIEPFPISTHKDIEVKIASTVPNKIDKKRGIIVWKKTLKPQESLEIGYEHIIKSPKDKVVLIDYRNSGRYSSY